MNSLVLIYAGTQTQLSLIQSFSKGPQTSSVLTLLFLAPSSTPLSVGFEGEKDGLEEEGPSHHLFYKELKQEASRSSVEGAAEYGQQTWFCLALF